jgi:hypothetical protein
VSAPIDLELPVVELNQPMKDVLHAAAKRVVLGLLTVSLLELQWKSIAHYLNEFWTTHFKDR